MQLTPQLIHLSGAEYQQLQKLPLGFGRLSDDQLARVLPYCLINTVPTILEVPFGQNLDAAYINPVLAHVT